MHISLPNHRDNSENKLLALQKKHPSFSFDTYTYTLQDHTLTVAFQFTLQPATIFTPTVKIDGVDEARFAKIPKAVVDNLVFHLGLIESISYWKAAAPQDFTIACGSLTAQQLSFWQQLIMHGMGEYAYINSIDLNYLGNITLRCTGQSVNATLFDNALNKGALQPIGGGKDSVVTAQILNDSGMRTMALLLNPTPAARSVAQIAQLENPIIVNRQLDPLLLQLNKEGYLNGHTPFSAYLAFLSVLCAVLFDYTDCVLSNERSENQGNVSYQGKEINHQYSKSFHFEKLFSEYVKKYLAEHVSYFSLLRPLYELQIAKLFSSFPQYHEAFRSCNVGQKTNSWCGNCAKCLFVYVMLFPFVENQKLIDVFGEDLLRKNSLLPIAKDLLGETKQKPFDCVGTYEEVRAACYLGLKKKEAGQVVLDYFENDVLSKYPHISEDATKILADWGEQNLLPDEYKQLLRKYVING